MNQFIKQSSGLIFVTIFQIFCFFQTSSFIHLHHTHDEDGCKIVVSIHPVDRHTPRHSDYHSDDHQHSSGDHHKLDLTFIKSTPRKAGTFQVGVFSQSKVITLNKPGFSKRIANFYCYPSTERIFSASIFPRSPPNFSC